MTIDDVAAIRTGLQFRGRVDAVPDGRYRVIQVKDLAGRGGVMCDELDRVHLERDASEFLVRPGDVLFLARGRPVAVVVPDGVPDNTVASGYFFIARPRTAAVVPEYLAWAVNGPLRDDIAGRMQGTHQPQLSLADFRALQIDVPPLGVQRKIVALDDLTRRERELCEGIVRLRAEVVRRACTNAVRHGRFNAGGRA